MSNALDWKTALVQKWYAEIDDLALEFHRTGMGRFTRTSIEAAQYNWIWAREDDPLRKIVKLTVTMRFDAWKLFATPCQFLSSILIIPEVYYEPAPDIFDIEMKRLVLSRQFTLDSPKNVREQLWKEIFHSLKLVKNEFSSILLKLEDKEHVDKLLASLNP